MQSVSVTSTVSLNITWDSESQKFNLWENKDHYVSADSHYTNGKRLLVSGEITEIIAYLKLTMAKNLQ